MKLSSGKREISRFFVSHSFYYVYARRATPLLALNEEELDLALQLVLASGSLKDLARVYQVSYPTIRLRVDRLIERVRQLANGAKPDPMMQLLAELVERGEISVPAARSVRDLYRQQKENSNDGGTVV